MIGRGRRMRRRVASAGVVGVAGVLAVGSAAWACTVVMGGIKVANPGNGTNTTIAKDGTVSGTPGGVSAAQGQILKVSAWELFQNETYALWFIFPNAGNTGVNCHTAQATTEKVIMKTPQGVKLKAIKTNGGGFFDRDPAMAGYQPYKAKVPTDARLEPGSEAEICADMVRPPTSAWDDSATHHVKIAIL